MGAGEGARTPKVGKEECFLQTDMLSRVKKSGLKYLKRGSGNQVFTPVTHNIKKKRQTTKNKKKNPVLLVNS